MKITIFLLLPSLFISTHSAAKEKLQKLEFEVQNSCRSPKPGRKFQSVSAEGLINLNRSDGRKTKVYFSLLCSDADRRCQIIELETRENVHNPPMMPLTGQLLGPITESGFTAQFMDGSYNVNFKTKKIEYSGKLDDIVTGGEVQKKGTAECDEVWN